VTLRPASVQATVPWIEPTGAIALLLAGAALLCPLSYSLSPWVIPFGLASLFVGLIGVARALVVTATGPAANTFRRRVFPSAGAGAGCLVCAAALFFPSLLGPNYLAWRQGKTVDPTTIQAIPLNGSPANGRIDSDWVDASQTALRQGRLHVQVASVSVEPLDANPVPKGKGPAEELLHIRLRIRKILEAGDAAPQGVDAPDEKTRQEARLTDNTGKHYLQRALHEATPPVQRRNAFASAVVDQVLVFEVPPAGLQHLRLELPVAHWGGRGVFRFTIPSTMVRRQN
jgi:hypothetical protein